MGVEEVYWFEAFSSDLGIEVDAAGAEAALLEDDEHAGGGEIDIGRELVGVPAEEKVASVGVDAAEEAVLAGVLHLVEHGVAGQGGVVGFDVELEVFIEAVGLEEGDATGGVEVVLVDGRFLGLGFDVELAGEADLLLVVDGEVEEAAEVIEFTLHVGVVEVAITFAATPEGVAGTAEVVGHFHRLLHLGGGVGEGVGVGAGGGAVNVTLVAEEVSGAPEELDTGALLLFLDYLDDGIEVLVALSQVLAFGGDVAIMEAVEADAELLQELEGDSDALLGHLDAVGAIFPGANGTAGTERISTLTPEGVPVGDGEAEPVVHGLAVDDFVSLVVLEAERVLAGGAFVGDFGGDFGEEGHFVARLIRSDKKRI